MNHTFSDLRGSSVYEIMLFKKRHARYHLKLSEFYSDPNILSLNTSSICIDKSFIECSDNNHEYYDHYGKSICINCNGEKQLEPVTIETEILVKILRYDKSLYYASRCISKGVRNASMPYIFQHELKRAIRGYEIHSVPRGDHNPCYVMSLSPIGRQYNLARVYKDIGYRKYIGPNMITYAGLEYRKKYRGGSSFVTGTAVIPVSSDDKKVQIFVDLATLKTILVRRCEYVFKIKINALVLNNIDLTANEIHEENLKVLCNEYLVLYKYMNIVSSDRLSILSVFTMDDINKIVSSK